MLNPEQVSDQKLIEAFESNDLEPGNFHHADHVQIAWIYCRRYGLLDALEKFSNGLKAFTKKIGQEKKYHETISWFFVIKINERILAQGEGSWEAFKDQNPDLMDYKSGFIFKHYSKKVITSNFARKNFILPDRNPSKG